MVEIYWNSFMWWGAFMHAYLSPVCCSSTSPVLRLPNQNKRRVPIIWDWLHESFFAILHNQGLCVCSRILFFCCCWILLYLICSLNLIQLRLQWCFLLPYWLGDLLNGISWQCYRPRRALLLPKPIIRKKRSFKRQPSHSERSKQRTFMQGACFFLALWISLKLLKCSQRLKF